MIELLNIRFENGFIYFEINDKDYKQKGNAIFSCDTLEVVSCDNKEIQRGSLWRAGAKLEDLINEYGLLELPKSASYVFY